MRVQCPQCGESVEVTAFTTEGDPPRMSYRCPACGQTVTETGLAPDSQEPPSSPAPSSASADAPGAALAEREGDDVLWRAWDRVAEDFSQEARHDAFLASCEASGALAFAAVRYREWRDSHPADEIAPRRLQQIAALAQVKAFLTVSRTSREEDPLRKALVMGLVLLAFILVAVLTAPLIFRGLRDHSSGSQQDPGAAMPPPLENLRPRQRSMKRPRLRQSPAPRPGPPRRAASGLAPPPR